MQCITVSSATNANLFEYCNRRLDARSRDGDSVLNTQPAQMSLRARGLRPLAEDGLSTDGPSLELQATTARLSVLLTSRRERRMVVR